MTTMHAQLTGRGAPTKALDRLVIVDDPELGPVNVRWALGRAQPWRCRECGPMTEASCAHTFAAGLLLAEDLLGLTRMPDLQPEGAPLT